MTTPPQIRTAFLALAAVLAISIGHAQASTNYYLKLGNIKGGSTQAGHLEWNVIDSFQWGLSVPVGSIGSGGGGGAGSPILSDLYWTQPIDKSFTDLFTQATSGKPMDKVTLHATTLVNDKEFTFFEMVFDKTIMTYLQLSGATGGAPYMQASFNYEKITMKYFTLDDKGKTTASLEGKFDLTKAAGDLASLSMAYSMGMVGPTIVASVPEAETWAMLLAGIGLIGFAVRRQSKRGRHMLVA